MRLTELLHSFANTPLEADLDILGLSLDSRAIQPGYLFLALRGTQADGSQFIHDAIRRGAVAVCIDADMRIDQVDIPCISIPDLRRKVGAIAARFYHHPAKKLKMIGVTGTSGKTSCTHFIAQSLQSLGMPCGIIGTLGSGFYGELGQAGLTTPDAVSLQASLHQFVERGAEAVAMEVSSHSIDQERVSAIDFEIGVFTNLSQDHLDYHGDMATYAAVKRRFLAEAMTEHIIINADDAYGKQWLAELAHHKPIIAYSIKPPRELIASVPFVYCAKSKINLQGIYAELHTPWGEGSVTLPLVGQFNLSNCLAVLAVLCLHGVAFQDALRSLERLHAVSGRMQTLGGQGKPLIVVDYAHKPDALEKVLEVLRQHTAGKLFCVFGCGGERDRGKRPLMAKIAEQWADQVIVTSDNPRHENPETIAQEIMAGFSHPGRVFLELDRSKAIEKSIQWAVAADCVLIAGKGAERYQQIGDQKLPFDDVDKARRALGDG